MRILIADDDCSLLEQLQQILTSQRYIVETAMDGEKALDKLFDAPFDLIILDIMMPKVDGLTVLEEARKAGIDTPMLMLTAKGDVANRVRGLDLGADDYLAKPFSLDELLARVRALLRRSGGQCESALQVQDLELNTVSRKVTKDGKPVELTPREFSILEFLSCTIKTGQCRVSALPNMYGETISTLSACPISWMFISRIFEKKSVIPDIVK